MSDERRDDGEVNLPPGVKRDRRVTLPGPDSMQRVKRRIGELLVEEGLVDPAQVDEALQLQETKGGKTVDLMIELGFMNEADFEQFMGRQPNTAGISLLNYRIDPKVFNLIPKDMAVEREIIPIDQLGRSLTIGMVCPLDWRTIETVSSMTGLRVSPVLCTHAELNEAIAKYYDHPDRED